MGLLSINDYDWTRVTITDHAYARSKERLGWTKKTTKRMCEKAFFEGLSMDDLHGSIHNYLKEKVERREKLDMDFRIYGEAIYVFSLGEDKDFGDTFPLLVTVLYVPNELKGQAKSLQRKRRVA